MKRNLYLSLLLIFFLNSIKNVHLNNDITSLFHDDINIINHINYFTEPFPAKHLSIEIQSQLESYNIIRKKRILPSINTSHNDTMINHIDYLLKTIKEREQEEENYIKTLPENLQVYLRVTSEPGNFFTIFNNTPIRISIGSTDLPRGVNKDIIIFHVGKFNIAYNTINKEFIDIEYNNNEDIWEDDEYIKPDQKSDSIFTAIKDYISNTLENNNEKSSIELIKKIFFNNTSPQKIYFYIDDQKKINIIKKTIEIFENSPIDIFLSIESFLTAKIFNNSSNIRNIINKIKKIKNINTLNLTLPYIDQETTKDIIQLLYKSIININEINLKINNSPKYLSENINSYLKSLFSEKKKRL